MRTDNPTLAGVASVLADFSMREWCGYRKFQMVSRLLGTLQNGGVNMVAKCGEPELALR